MLGAGRRSQRERGARPASLLKEIGGASHEDEETSRQKEARGGGAHGPGPIGDSRPAGDDAAEEDADDSQENEASRTAVRSGRLGPDEPHDGHPGEDRAARPESRANLAFGVTSPTSTSETFAERGVLVPAPLLSTRRLYSTGRAEATG